MAAVTLNSRDGASDCSRASVTSSTSEVTANPDRLDCTVTSFRATSPRSHGDAVLPGASPRTRARSAPDATTVTRTQPGMAHTLVLLCDHTGRAAAKPFR